MEGLGLVNRAMLLDVIRRTVFFVLRWSQLPRAYSVLRQRGKVTILLYHDIDPGTFASHLDYLEKKYVIISLDDYLDAAAHGRDLGSEKYLVITFDDGHKGNFALRGLFARHPGKVVLFLCAGIVGTARGFWFETKGLDVGALKRLPNGERLRVLEGAGFIQDRDRPQRTALSREEVLALGEVADIQSHTVFHPCLPFCTDAEAAWEIAESRRLLEAACGTRVNSISYPNGDYSDRDVALSRESGYVAGITVDHGFNDHRTDPFRLKRLSVNDTRDMNEFVVKASGLWGALLRFVARPRHGRMDPVGEEGGRCG
jgi:peptidoglycan/xylan/chitin deacetylase (PgdA/CDA1 family)